MQCLLDAEIQTLVDIYNEKIGSLKGLNKQQVLDVLEKKTGCANEECVVCKILEAVKGSVYESVVLRIKEVAFKIDGPVELTALLDSFLIIRLCRQLEANHQGVKFGGVLTIDFMIPPLISIYGAPVEVWKDFEANRWKQLQMVFNIDHRMGTGQHWTSMTIDSEHSEIEYFDSYGLPPPDGILVGSRAYKNITDEQGRFLSLLRNWINEVRLAFVHHGLPLRFVYNTTRHQAPKDQSNCGPYSILFLALRAKQVPFSRITAQTITTEEIERIRNRLYRRSPDYVPTLP
jgi:hypothetical protein